MKKMMQGVLITSLLFSCSSSGNIQPEGSSQALPVFNQAYQENFEPDSIEAILEEARNAYVLLDPFTDIDLSPYLPQLKERGNQLSAYISIGTGEDWRSDFNQLRPYLSSLQWDDWRGEYYISITGEEVLAVMKSRIDKIAERGFDWVEFDNMDWIFDEETRANYALAATEAEGLAYIQTLREYALGQGLKCMAKNMRKGAENFDGVTFESYANNKDWWDSEDLKLFLREGKPGIIVHYNERNPDSVYLNYMEIYGDSLSFIAESKTEKSYIHYNE